MTDQSKFKSFFILDGQDFVQRMEILQKISKHKGCVRQQQMAESIAIGHGYV